MLSVPAGEVALTLGALDVEGNGTDGLLTLPCDVVTAENGDISVSDGHSDQNTDATPETASRIVKFNSEGNFLASIGHWTVSAGTEAGWQIGLERVVGFGLGAGQRDDGQLAAPLERTDIVENIPPSPGPVVEELVAERGGQGPEGDPDEVRMNDILSAIRRPGPGHDTVHKMHRSAGSSPATITLGEPHGEIALNVPQDQVVE